VQAYRFAQALNYFLDKQAAGSLVFEGSFERGVYSDLPLATAFMGTTSCCFSAGLGFDGCWAGGFCCGFTYLEQLPYQTVH
jgi:hypothetical protein